MFYDYTITTTTTIIANVVLTITSDPATPGYKAPPDTTGGMPVIKVNVAGPPLIINLGQIVISGLWFVGTTTMAGAGVTQNYAIFMSTNYDAAVFGCVMDQFGFDVGLAMQNGVGVFSIIGCETFSSVAAGSPGTSSSLFSNTDAPFVISGCNIHDCVGVGVSSRVAVRCGIVVINSIIAKCQSDGIQNNGYGGAHIQNCTIDGNLGNGINGGFASIFNCIISNHTGGGKFGSSLSTVFGDYNVYYNNTTDISGGTYGPHDTHGGANPYVGQSTENYTLA